MFTIPAVRLHHFSSSVCFFLPIGHGGGDDHGGAAVVVVIPGLGESPAMVVEAAVVTGGEADGASGTDDRGCRDGPVAPGLSRTPDPLLQH